MFNQPINLLLLLLLLLLPTIVIVFIFILFILLMLLLLLTIIITTTVVSSGLSLLGTYCIRLRDVHECKESIDYQQPVNPVCKANNR